MNMEKMRDEYEAWAISDAASTDKALQFERGGDWYLGKDHQVMNLGWAAWQASREALVIELPELAPNDDSQVGEPWDCGFNCCHKECREAIEAAGVKVKP